MTWIEKIFWLKGDRTFSSIEREANWTKNTLSNAVNAHSMPGADLGVSLATALDVSAHWLFNDSLGKEDYPYWRLSQMIADSEFVRGIRQLGQAHPAAIPSVGEKR